MPDNIIVTVDENKAIKTLKGIEEKKVREFIEIVDRAYKKKPDAKDIRDLNKWLKEYPEIWQVVFDLSNVIEHNFITSMIPDQAAQLAVKKNIEQIRRDLGYHASPMMEKLLIDNIVLAWLRVQWTEYQLVVFMGASEIRMSVIEFWEKRLGGAQRRYLRACETLTRIRQVANPKAAVQVNIAGQGGQQVNVAGNVVKK